jgi:hypothetical protein
MLGSWFDHNTEREQIKNKAAPPTAQLREAAPRHPAGNLGQKAASWRLI